MNTCVLILNNCESAVITISPEDNYEEFATKMHQAIGLTLKKQLSPSATFTYLDEDEDCISMCSEIEFQEMKNFAASRKLLIVNILDLDVKPLGFVQSTPNAENNNNNNNIYDNFAQNEVIGKFGEAVAGFKDKVSSEFVEIKDKLSTELPKIGEKLENNIQAFATTLSTIFTQENVNNVQTQISELFQKFVEQLPKASEEVKKEENIINNDNNQNVDAAAQNVNKTEESQITDQERECINKIKELGFDHPNLSQIVRKYRCDLHIILDQLINL